MSIDGMANRGQAKRSDPWTSKTAAEVVRPGSQRRRLLEAHKEHPKGMTDEEAATAAGVSLLSEYATRCSELMRAGLLRDTTVSRQGVAGMQRIVRKITGDGIVALVGPPRVSPLRGSDGVEGIHGIREDGEPPLCSCGRGYVGHTRDHESTDKPGTIRIVREGKTDQYINLRVAEAQAVNDAAKRSRVEDVERQKATPRVVLSGRDVGFGGRMPCSKCDGSGGSLWEACLYCDGTGLR